MIVANWLTVFKYLKLKIFQFLICSFRWVSLKTGTVALLLFIISVPAVPGNICKIVIVLGAQKAA